MDTQTQHQDVAVQTPHDGQQARQQQTAAPAPAARRAPQPFVRPRAHLTETPNEFFLQIELPGVGRDGLEVSFENGELTVTGRPAAFQAGSAELIHRESRQADFRRVFEVDPSIDAARIGARLEQGTLTLTLPKSEAARPRRIEVQHAPGN